MLMTTNTGEKITADSAGLLKLDSAKKIADSVRNLIRNGVTADGLLGGQAMSNWGAHSYEGVLETEGAVGLKFKVNGKKFKGWVYVVAPGYSFGLTVSFSKNHGGKWLQKGQFTEVDGEQLAAVIDAFVQSDAEIAVV